MSPRRAAARPSSWQQGASLALLACALLARAIPAAAEDAPIPEPVGYVNDVAGVMDEPARAKLEGFLDQLHTKTGAQFAVLTVKSTAPGTPAEYKVRVFQSWGIGKKGADDGLLMLVALEERRVEFETGYGLEGTLTDGYESQVVRRDIAPRFREGDYAGGITAGVLACASRIAAEKGVTLEWDGRELRYSPGRGRHRDPPFWVALLVFFLILPIFMIVARASTGIPGPMGRRRRYWRGGYWGGGFGGGSFGGGFGGFGGGGGGGGGGGFGGFGGGGSGGGGGGGSW